MRLHRNKIQRYALLAIQVHARGKAKMGRNLQHILNRAANRCEEMAIISIDRRTAARMIGCDQ